MKITRRRIGEWIRKERRKTGATQAELAAYAGVTPDWISHIESGRRYPSLPVFLAIAEALCLNLNDVLWP